MPSDAHTPGWFQRSVPVHRQAPSQRAHQPTSLLPPPQAFVASRRRHASVRAVSAIAADRRKRSQARNHEVALTAAQRAQRAGASAGARERHRRARVAPVVHRRRACAARLAHGARGANRPRTARCSHNPRGRRFGREPDCRRGPSGAPRLINVVPISTVAGASRPARKLLRHRMHARSGLSP